MDGMEITQFTYFQQVFSHGYMSLKLRSDFFGLTWLTLKFLNFHFLYVLSLLPSWIYFVIHGFLFGFSPGWKFAIDACIC